MSVALDKACGYCKSTKHMRKKGRQHKMGPIGECVCPKCEMRITHRRGVPCQEERCPRCQVRMLRVDSDDYQLWMKKKTTKTVAVGTTTGLERWGWLSLMVNVMLLGLHGVLTLASGSLSDLAPS